MSSEVLENRKLLECIFSQFDVSDIGDDYLAKCARVCKLWSDPALDMLWGRQESMPVLCILKIIPYWVRKALH